MSTKKHNTNDHAFTKKELDKEESIEVPKKKLHTKKAKAKKSGKRKSHHAKKKEIDEELMAIYENGDGSMPDMTHFQSIKRKSFWQALVTLLIACGFLGAVAYAGFFIFQPTGEFEKQGVIVSISGEEQVIFAEEGRYRVRYRNAQHVPLSQVIVEVRYPSGFVFTDSSVAPTNDTNDEWTLGSLEPGESGYIDIFGKLYGSIGEEKSFRLFLNYLPSNFSSPFQEVATENIRISYAPVDVSVDGPDNVANGGEVTFHVSLDPIESTEGPVAFVIEGDGFTIKESTPAADEFDDRQWTFDALSEKQEIIIQGGINAGSRETIDLQFKLLAWQDQDKKKESYIVSTSTKNIVVEQTNLVGTLIINGTTKDVAVSPGEILHTSVIVKNSGSVPVENVQARLVYDAPSANRKSILHWFDVEDENDGDIFGEQITDVTRRGQITWDKGEVPAFNTIAVGDEVTLDVRLPVKDADSTDLTSFNTHAVDAFVEITFSIDGVEQVYTTPVLTLDIQSDLDIEVRDDVGKDNQGKETHDVTWIITNTFHPLENVLIEADFYGDITLHEQDMIVPAGEITYDSEEQKLTWRISSMPQSIDVLAFQVPLTINTKNLSQTSLTSRVVVTATDAKTGEEILRVDDGINL
ncbi:MAG: hypothetical protein HOC34_02345 [Candidatus Magasanikbacteria bacterium]|jgi:hypothetical protein|nr:hypothetical protein [Candidatus Magasanikbacteria bacterium]MBT4220851.1 hypothetical protein [Candidatus Magasanikbacteria bacterium]MBT4350876.1 hypothetical protein [Candidatus Magasanikbacteria bacterium]MBT4541782.1 hypothetical protein [Candidatus Magasanikbacteria bacterium]MBT6253203.1 hypothetical protein [Candidatus Magasanikbacteria bacterium]